MTAAASVRAGLRGLLDDVACLRLLVVGDAILDRYTTGASGRLCREAPVPAVTVRVEADRCGGAANVAMNAHALGAASELVTVLGADPAGYRLAALLRAGEVESAGAIHEPGWVTPVRNRVFAGEQMVVRLDHGGAEPISAGSGRAVIERVDEALPRADAIVVSDNGSGVLVPAVIDALADRRVRGPAVLVVDSRDPAALRDLRPTAVKPNYREALRTADRPDITDAADRVRYAHRLADTLLSRTGADYVALTLDRDGALLIGRDRPPVRTYAGAERARSSVGAGDTFTAALALALAAHADPATAAEFATAAADIAVASPGTALCRAAELDQRVSGTARIADLGDLARRCAENARHGRRVVFTNGCFDILHGGHVSLLGRAKELGDLLVVGVNSDASVRRLKGDQRPVSTLSERMRVLAALSCVDLVVPFEGDRPTDLIETIRPHVYVKGADYTDVALPEAELVRRLGGEVVLLPLVEQLSTSGIIERVRAARGAGYAAETGDTP
ncbi:D-glycero-beta-D-manno-heptose 1-phosphate adenylyltransferase [Nocardia sp. NPDC047038]|uniref:D-glycero-beta-D-manno-heptose 1-phosphate adenylyltransferase n=1 Tax=Nocardia sp. NPDC047038 TaxID=3154338 RepID=UPI0033DE6ACC